MSTITISECFGVTIQGEGALIGKPTVFVRTGGCEYRCSWCDTLYAVLPEHKDEWKPMKTEEVFAEIQRLSPTPILVTLSGGNPAIQPLGDLIDLGAPTWLHVYNGNAGECDACVHETSRLPHSFPKAPIKRYGNALGTIRSVL